MTRALFSSNSRSNARISPRSRSIRARRPSPISCAAGAAPHVPAERIARLAPCGVLVASGLAEANANAMRDHLANAGFSDIAVFTGAPPTLGAESMGSVAA